ncbi:hypothetical protein EVAR_44227_1 [Eumeta japonica]|uniref:Uncharacterized protein n=1 Tax=Eumeta variegata TaxID=151549 RepID=A0A4C1W2J5_EUMVA|nr:hypothetical protein EVAR_44227_1 [Eumeta japonica]
MMVFKDHFYLLGHTFGVIVALEMAARLEKQGLVGTVFCVDTSPDALPIQLSALLQLSPDHGIDDQALQNSIVEHICKLLVDGYDSSEPMAVWAKELQRAVGEAKDWPSKVDAGVRQLRGRVPHSFQYARAHIEAAYARIRESLRYSAEALAAQPLSSHLVLARRALQEGEAAVLPSDLGLSRLSSAPVSVHELTAGGVDDLRLPAVINKYMRPQELEQFSKRDLRESYLLCTDKYISYFHDYAPGENEVKKN